MTILTELFNNELTVINNNDNNDNNPYYYRIKLYLYLYVTKATKIL